MVLSVWYKGNPLREVVLEFCILKSKKNQQQKTPVPLWVYLNARYMVIDLVISLCWDWQMWDISQHPGRKVRKNKTKPHKQRTTTRNMKKKKKDTKIANVQTLYLVCTTDLTGAVWKVCPLQNFYWKWNVFQWHLSLIHT